MIRAGNYRLPEWKERKRAESVCIRLSELPPSANKMYAFVGKRGRKRVIKSPVYRAWQKNVGKELLAQRPGSITSPCSVSIRLGNPSNRRRDVDNCAKVLMDALVKFGIIPDDNSNIVRAVALAWSPDVTGVEIRVVPA